MKKRLAAALLASLAASASAQGTSQATFTPITIDGTVRPKGSVVVNGKTYVSLDDLKAAGVTVLKPNSLGIYHFNRATPSAVKLTGCMNEWLTDGVTRIRITSVYPYAFYKTFTVFYDIQTALESTSVFKTFDPGKTRVTLKDGTRIDPAKDAFAKIEVKDLSLQKATLVKADVTFSPVDYDENNPPAQLVMTPSASSKIKGAWTFNLNCKK